MSRKNKVEKLAEKLNKIEMLNEPLVPKHVDEEYMEKHKDDLSKAAVFDIEGTGLNKLPLPWGDEIIELAILPFLYNKKTKEIVKPLEAYQSFNEPSELSRITEEITELTGITQEDVKGHKIDWDEVEKVLEDVDFVVAHNVKYDKAMILKYISKIPRTYCSLRDVNWNDKIDGGFLSASQEILTVEFDCVHDSHRAIYDVYGLYNLLLKSDSLKDLLEEKVEVRVGGGFISPEFNEFYFKENWFRFNYKEKYWYKTVKKAKVQEIKDFVNEYAPQIKKGFIPVIDECEPYSTK